MDQYEPDKNLHIPIYLLTNLTHIKHKNDTNIIQSPGTYRFMTYLRETVNQKVNILMKTKIEINLNRKCD